MNVENDGYVGSAPGYQSGALVFGIARPDQDLQTLRISWQPSFEFPGRSKNNFLEAGYLNVGGIHIHDTLASAAYEFSSYDVMHERSCSPQSSHYDSRAVVEQEYAAVYSDTTVWLIRSYLDPVDHRPHEPMGIEVHQTSYASSNGSLRRCVIVDCWIKNMSTDLLRAVCVGISLEPNAFHYDNSDGYYSNDDMCGFLRAVPGIVEGTVDTINIAWAADSDGDPGINDFTSLSPTGVLGVCILRPREVAGRARLSFNWWQGMQFFGTHASVFLGWGPTKSGDMPGGGVSQKYPSGDRSLYRMMVGGEIDHDQAYSAVNMVADGWHAPPDAELARQIAAGGLNTLLLSAGPIGDIAPGDSLPFTYALIAGEGFHRDPDNFADNFSAADPKPYLDNLDFSDLIDNARQADWIFDTPGEDTDGDGNCGKFYLVDCKGSGQTGCDTVWYKGDGVPDWGGTRPPSPPPFTLTTQPHTAILRWDGAITETAKDHLSGRRDWEGYRVYMSRFDVNDQYALISSWDLGSNYTRWAYTPKTEDWRQISYPLTVEQWRQEIGDPSFNPTDYVMPSFTTAYCDTIVDTVLNVRGEIISIDQRERYSYWEPQGPNRANRYWTSDNWEENPIQKVGERDTIIGTDTLTFGVYECVIEKLNGAIPMYFAVTAFDYGDYLRSVEPEESAPHGNNKFGYLVYSADVVTESTLQVSVYPNPYKIRFADAFGRTTNYYEQGYEAAGKSEMTERDRRIWFINLPDTATIQIWSLDGDLIREIHHPDKFLTQYSSVVGWDLVSRNTQAVVSGIYLWRVDSRLGHQIGKLVIIK